MNRLACLANSVIMRFVLHGDVVGEVVGSSPGRRMGGMVIPRTYLHKTHGWEGLVR